MSAPLGARLNPTNSAGTHVPARSNPPTVPHAFFALHTPTHGPSLAGSSLDQGGWHPPSRPKGDRSCTTTTCVCDSCSCHLWGVSPRAWSGAYSGHEGCSPSNGGAHRTNQGDDSCAGDLERCDCRTFAADCRQGNQPSSLVQFSRERRPGRVGASRYMGSCPSGLWPEILCRIDPT